jgi:class 3 adenylate cyclase
MDQPHSKKNFANAEAPFPLKQRFQRQILPLLAVLVVASVVMSLYHGSSLIESVYLEQAQMRAAAIARAMERTHPERWHAMLNIQPREEVPILSEDDPFRRAIEGTLVDARLAKLKIYDDQARLLFTTQGVEAGNVDLAPPLMALLRTKKPQIELKDTGDERLYEIYVWLPDGNGDIGEVFELYEPAEFLNSLLVANVVPQLLLPLAVMGGLTLVLWRTVSRAQNDIDRRAEAVRTLSQRLERLVSTQALGAARRAEGDGLDSRVLDLTLFYSDIRSFTSYAEENPPQEVVSFLNDVMTLQVHAIYRHGGDVDKMIGDAVLAIFEGPDRAVRAVACAREILDEFQAQTEWPRLLGIGLHDGFVISGTIGPPERQDFTVIGDAVNVAARLCAEAKGGELVTDTRTLARAGHPQGFSAVEEVHVKGRSEPLRIRRLRASSQVT